MARKEIMALTNHANKVIGRQWKFEASNVYGDADNSGNLTLGIAYRDNPATSVASTITAKSYSGNTVIQLSNQGASNMPLTFGNSPWMSG